MSRTKTMDLKGKAYAQVKDRLQAFWKENPQGSVKATPEFMPDGQVHFSAHIIKDKANPASGDATGHALGKTGQKEKDFEKLETIAVGRALALLGYGADGEIASSEEMEEFEAYKAQKLEELLFASQEKLEECKSLDELKTAWAALPIQAKTALEAAKEKMKVKLTPKPKPAKKEPTEEVSTEQV